MDVTAYRDNSRLDLPEDASRAASTDDLLDETAQRRNELFTVTVIPQEVEGRHGETELGIFPIQPPAWLWAVCRRRW
ncbi:hypothetical protein [Protofrankia coriariae]|uniref:Uncharacterized protein n=1 Tax=Protofrankia coriariae TaxID=1562887 RepID=A0ABR5EYI7_9ACTN|nr:hypothetical protein [Protofrankia coriariae]KLL09532.1 hypothetical protein FrCorBMG51_24235 [Protofrankia coriariae]ONH30729.1 hypothetical protein BL254_23905 [Protofrankia sp. BMG5.30]